MWMTYPSFLDTNFLSDFSMKNNIRLSGKFVPTFLNIETDFSQMDSS